MSNSKQLVLGVLGSLIASAIWAAIGRITKIEPLWVSGTAGFIAGCGITFSIATWWLGKRAHVAQKVVGSALGFVEFVQEATSSIFAIGSTLNFLARDPEAKKILHQKLADTKFELRLLISSPETANLWRLIGFNESYEADLKNARREFTDWSKKHGNLTVKDTFLVTTSFLFVDADQKTGKLLIIPLPWRVIAGKRPCFMVSKEHHPIAFDTYYDAYRELFGSEYCKTIELPTDIPT